MKRFAKAFAICIAVSLSCGVLAACAGDAEPEAPETTETASAEAETPSEAPTTEPTTQEPAKPEKQVLSVNWHDGYVGSASNVYNQNKLTETTGTMYSYTDVITIPKAGTRITFTDDGGLYASAAAYVISSWKQQADGTWALDLKRPNYAGSGSAESEVLKTVDGTLTYVYITSLDNENLRLCYRSEHSASFTPVFPTVYAEETDLPGTAQERMDDLQWIEDQKAVQYYSSLEKLTINAIGDSYFAGNGLRTDHLWLSLLGYKYDIDMNNYGINGSTMSDYLDPQQQYHPISKRYQDLPNNDPDIVLLEGGRNDYNRNTPLGTVDSTDTATFMGALNTVLSGLRAKYPNAVIICLTNWNYDGTNTQGLGSADYANAMKTVAERHGAYCFAANDPALSGVDMTSFLFRNNYCMNSNDISHLNYEGMKLFLPKIEAYIAQCYAEAKKEAK